MQKYAFFVESQYQKNEVEEEVKVEHKIETIFPVKSIVSTQSGQARTKQVIWLKRA